MSACSPPDAKLKLGCGLRQQQTIGLDSEGNGKLLKIVERNIPGVALNMSNERSMQAGFQCQAFLRPFTFLTQTDQIFSQYAPG